MRAIFAMVAMLLIYAVSAVSAFAGDTMLYSKLGVMDWKERADGKQTVRETGAIQEFGVGYKTNYAGLDLDSELGMWGAEIYYNGSKLETGAPYKTLSGDIGIKAYTGLTAPVPITDKLTMATMAGLNLNSFVRVVPGELWLVLGAKTGMVARYENVEVKAGIQYPFLTTDTAYQNAAGVKGLVTARPKGLISPFGEASVKIDDRWSTGAYVEMWRWAASDSVPFQYSGNAGTALANKSRLFQPDTNVISSGVSLEYRF